MISRRRGLPIAKDPPIICWFRRDLRVNDNPALFEAAKSGRPVIPLFIFDDDLTARMTCDGSVFDFQAEALSDLSARVSNLGGTLLLRKGKRHAVFAQLVKETGASSVFFNLDYEPYALERDAETTRFLRTLGVHAESFHDVVIHRPDELATAEGKPYSVFTPFAARWIPLPKPVPPGKPRKFFTPSASNRSIIGSKGLGRQTSVVRRFLHGGESAATRRWTRFLKEKIAGYAGARDFPATDGTSMMSSYLRFGCISPLRMYSDLAALRLSAGAREKESIDTYIKELIWREFFISALYHFPFTAERNFRREFDRLEWSENGKSFQAWSEGRTGFPIVDAGMRQLNATGWMHNRVRMVVASFLTKDLLTDWRKGAEYFATKLLDLEPASNVGGWQWSASTGVDRRPLRIFNPVLQSRRFDPGAEYIKEWLPELRNVPAKWAHAPNEMSAALQEKTGVTIGRDYPFPITNHREASALFRHAYFSIRNLPRP